VRDAQAAVNQLSSDSTFNLEGFQVFSPGKCTYDFEIILDNEIPESIDARFGKVEYSLHASVERDTLFRPKISGMKKISVIRSPPEDSDEQTRPVTLQRRSGKDIQIDFTVIGRSFPLGSQVPVTVKLTPLRRVECHSIQVAIYENI
jgi:hypothetical protein